MHPQYSELRYITENNVIRQPTQNASITKTLHKNPKASFTSLILQDIEHGILMRMEEYFANNGYETSVRVFDGLQLVAQACPIPAQLLRGCEDYIRHTTGFEIQLAEKDMNEDIDIRTIAATSGPLTEDAWKHKYIKSLLAEGFGRWRWNKDWEKIGQLLYATGISLTLFQQLTEKFVNKHKRDQCCRGCLFISGWFFCGASCICCF